MYWVLIELGSMVGWGLPNGVGKPEPTAKERESCVPYKLVIAIVISTAVLVVAAGLIHPGVVVSGLVEAVPDDVSIV
jgi:hypothetical protein